MNKRLILAVTAALTIFGLTMAAVTAQLQYKHLKDQVENVKASAISEKPQIDYLNAIRAAHGLPALAYDEGLNSTAKSKVEDLIGRSYFNHDTPDKQPFYNLPFKVRPGLKFYGENIGQCYASQAAMFKAYEESPGHLKNIIDPNYKLFGGYTQWDDHRMCFVNANEFGG